MNNDKEYVFFPLFMLSDLFKVDEVKKHIGNMFEYGIWKYANTIKINSYKNVYRQIIYCYFMGGLTGQLEDFLIFQKDNGYISLSEDYKGFDIDSDSYEPDDLDDLEYIGNHNNDFSEMAIQFYKVRQALQHLGLKGDVSYIISIGQKFEEVERNHIALYGTDPNVMLKTKLLLDFRDNKHEPNNIMVLSVYAAIKSIIGKEKFGSATKEIIVSRMIGAKSKHVLAELLKNDNLKAIYEKFMKRYHFDKLMNEIDSRNFLKSKLAIKKGGKSRLYFSTTLDHKTLAELIAKQANKQNNTNKKKLEIEAKAYFKLLTSA